MEKEGKHLGRGTGQFPQVRLIFWRVYCCRLGGLSEMYVVHYPTHWAPVCGAPGAEVVARSGVVATAISCYRGGGCPGPSGGIRTLCVMRVMLAYIKI